MNTFLYTCKTWCKCFCLLLQENLSHMKITIIGGGNMGGAIAIGLANCGIIPPQNITVINRRQEVADKLKSANSGLNAVVGQYELIAESDVVIIALKPWLFEDFLNQYKSYFSNKKQLLVSVAAKVNIEQMESWTIADKPIFRVIPNTAIALRQSMTFIASKNADKAQSDIVVKLFSELGKVEVIDEKLIPAATSLASCGIAYAFRYIRAAMEGGVEMGLYPDQAKHIVMQTLKGAVELLEANNSHPEQEVDKVTTAGGITIKGLNEMEHAGFTSAVIKGLKASNIE